MKNWLTIGQFSQEVSLSQRTLRVYEKVGLIKAHTRGENKYRYYTNEQIKLVERIKQFKSFGFSLYEIRSLLEIDISMDSGRLASLLEKKLGDLDMQQAKINSSQQMIRKILTSLKSNKQGLDPSERRFIMNQFEKISVVVAGIRNLEETANYIKDHIEKSGKNIPVIIWDGKSLLPQRKPFIFVVSEDQLKKNNEISTLAPDVVVIKELSRSSNKIQEAYIQLYGSAGPHMATILNADDRAVIELAGNETLRKGKTYYFSKNSGLKPQISKIGGVISDGEKIEIFGFNHSAAVLEIKLNKILGFDDEIAYLASLAAVMDFGLKEEMLQKTAP
ncbi:MAG: MerR family transcriptional regulator [Pseudobdellovibrionaceae bacterium]